VELELQAFLISMIDGSAQIFHISMSHLKIQFATKGVTRRELRTEKPQILGSMLQNLIFVNNQLDAQFFFTHVYFYSLHVSGSHVPIIRRINCINTSGYSV